MKLGQSQDNVRMLFTRPCPPLVLYFVDLNEEQLDFHRPLPALPVLELRPIRALDDPLNEQLREGTTHD